MKVVVAHRMVAVDENNLSGKDRMNSTFLSSRCIDFVERSQLLLSLYQACVFGVRDEAGREGEFVASGKFCDPQSVVNLMQRVGDLMTIS